MAQPSVLDQLAPVQATQTDNPLDALAPIVGPVRGKGKRPPNLAAKALGQIVSPVPAVQTIAREVADIVEGVRRPRPEPAPADIRDLVPKSITDAAMLAAGIAAGPAISVAEAGKAALGLVKDARGWGLPEFAAAARGFTAGTIEGIGSTSPLDWVFLALGRGRIKARRGAPAAEPTFRAPTPEPEISDIATQIRHDLVGTLREQARGAKGQPAAPPRVIKGRPTGDAFTKEGRADIASAEATREALVRSESELPAAMGARMSEAAGLTPTPIQKARIAAINEAAQNNLDEVARAAGIPEAEIAANRARRGGAAGLVERSEKLAEEIAPPKAPPEARIPDPAAVQAAVAETIAPVPVKLAPLPPMPGKPGTGSRAVRKSARKARQETRQAAVPPAPATAAIISRARADLFGSGVGAQVNTPQGPGIVSRIYKIGDHEILEARPSRGKWRDPVAKNPKLGIVADDLSRPINGVWGDWGVTRRSEGVSALTTDKKLFPPEYVERLRKSEKGAARPGVLAGVAGAGIGAAVGAAAGETPGERAALGGAGAVAGALAGRGLSRSARRGAAPERPRPAPPTTPAPAAAERAPTALVERPRPGRPPYNDTLDIGPPPRGVEPDMWKAINAIEREANRLMDERGILDPRLVSQMQRFWGAEEAGRRVGLTGRSGAAEIRRITGEQGRQPMVKMAADLDARYRYLIEDPRGYMRTEALVAAGGAAAGGLAGATIEGETVEDVAVNALAGALIGGVIAGGTARAASALRQAGLKKSAKATADTVELTDTANLLAGPAAIKASFGAMGGVAAGTYQRIREGAQYAKQGRTAESVKAYGQARAALEYLPKQGVADYLRTLFARDITTLMQQSTSQAYVTRQVTGRLQKVAAQVLRPFIAADRTGVNALQKAGFGVEEARRLMLVGEPTSWAGQSALNLLQSNFLFRMLAKFSTVRVSAIERAIEFTPGLHRINIRVPRIGPLSKAPMKRAAQFRARRFSEDLAPEARRARAEFGALAALAGGAYGYVMDPSLQHMGVVSSISGPAFLPVAGAMAAGKALRGGEGAGGALAEILSQVARSVPQIGEAEIGLEAWKRRVSPLRPLRRAVGLSEEQPQ